MIDSGIISAAANQIPVFYGCRPKRQTAWADIVIRLERNTAQSVGIVSLSAFAIGFMAFGSILTTAAQSIWF